jgi:hypothetical protein
MKIDGTQSLFDDAAVSETTTNWAEAVSLFS